MPVCSFTLTHAGTPQTLFPVAQRAVAEEGGDMSGAPAAGHIRMPTPAGDVHLDYTASGRQLQIAVQSKPFLVSCARIQSELAALLAEVPAPEPIDVPGESGPAFTAPAYYVSPTEVIAPEQRQRTIDFTEAEAGTVYARKKINWPLFAGISAAAVGSYFLLQKALPSSRRGARRRRTTVRAFRV